MACTSISTRDGVSLRTIGHGDRGVPSVVLVHGLASNARLWDGVGAELAGRGVASVAVDLRGHGQSDRPDGGYGTQMVADDVADVVRALDAGPIVLVGQSWGGNVALEAAARHPDLVRAVVCVDGGFIRLAEDFPDPEAMWEVLAPPRFDGLTMAEIEVRLRIRLDGWPDSAVSGALANFEELADGTVRSRLSRDRHRAILDGLWAHDPDQALQEVRCPVVMVVAGDSDRKRERIDVMRRIAQNGFRVEWVDAEHDVHAQHPRLVAHMIESVL